MTNNNDEVKNILQERGSDYGAFHNNAEVSYKLMRFYFSVFEKLSPQEKYVNYTAFNLIFQKIGRVLSGNIHHLDSYQDCIGYLLLVRNYSSKDKPIDRNALFKQSLIYNYLNGEKKQYWKKLEVAGFDSYFKKICFSMDTFIRSNDKNYKSFLIDYTISQFNGIIEQIKK